MVRPKRHQCLLLCAEGRDIFGATDEFHFFYQDQELTGDLVLSDRVTQLAEERPGTKVGVAQRTRAGEPFPDGVHGRLAADGELGFDTAKHMSLKVLCPRRRRPGQDFFWKK